MKKQGAMEPGKGIMVYALPPFSGMSDDTKKI